MQKIKFILFFLIVFVLPDSCWAFDLDTLKTDFLQGNYRRVIFEGQTQVDLMSSGNTDELNYILGLSYLKESKLDLAQDCFRRILSNSKSKFKKETSLAMADTYLVSGQFQQAEDIYSKLIVDDFNSNQKPAILYRLSQLEFKKGVFQKGSDYWLKLKRDFPLSPELRLTKGIASINIPANDSGEYSIQVGFFTNSVNADNFKNKLLSKNYPAYVENFGAGFRVKVGRFKLQKEVLDLERKLSGDGFQTKICP
jgi:tetratricopeptide (TPR) repeat protein